MVDTVAADFRTMMTQRIEAAHQTLASRWLEQLKSLISIAPNEIFPGDQLLGHIPTLILELAAFFRMPTDEAISANAIVMARATEIGRLRHAQQASVHQVLTEYRLLREVITEFVAQETWQLNLTPTVHDVFDLTERLDAVIDVLLRTTVDTFMTECTQTITQHAARLESFNRMVTHELRQPLGTLQFAVKMLATPRAFDDPEHRGRILATAERNVANMSETLAKLVALFRQPESADSALVQRVELSRLTQDVADQLREMADVRGVDIRVSGSLPAVTINVGRLELSLLNLISNAIKYSDPDKPVRVVEIEAVPSP